METESAAAPASSAPLPDSREILQKMLDGLGLHTKVEQFTMDGSTLLHIATAEPGRLIGKHGQTLSQLQFLLNRILQRAHPGRAARHRRLRTLPGTPARRRPQESRRCRRQGPPLGRPGEDRPLQRVRPPRHSSPHGEGPRTGSRQRRRRRRSRHEENAHPRPRKTGGVICYSHGKTAYAFPP